MAETQKTRSTKNTTTGKKFSAEERDAMKERAKELKAATTKAEDEKAQLEKIAEMSDSDRAIAERLHAIITATAPGLAPKTWYGMPAYYKDGEVVCFFTPADKFKARYASFGFNEAAKLDDGAMWPTAFALQELTAAVEARIKKLVKTAVAEG